MAFAERGTGEVEKQDVSGHCKSYGGTMGVIEMKNIDVIRQMSVEELAEFLDLAQVDGMTGNGSTKKEWVEYLTAEAQCEKQ